MLASSVMTEDAPVEVADGTDQGLTIDELSAVTGLSVRTTRYYASLGLIPPPERRGRVAVYGAGHRARLELLTALQGHGFTLQAIERFFAQIPADATPEDLAVQRTLIMSWTSEAPEDTDARLRSELLALGLQPDALDAAAEAVRRHMGALADDLTAILRSDMIEPFRRTPHTPEDAARLQEALPRIRRLVLEAIVAGFQASANAIITRSLGGDEAK